ncbi:vesicle-fusing ATPase-like [Artemia franciscana]|uniref:vesicle-fusing ATPase-like n=1 Tax=Artemia franciscana TaxID=6661 RepID=UPI0032DB3E16
MKNMEADQVDELRDKLGIKVSGPSPPKPVSSFAHLSLDEGLLKVIWEMEYTQPTPIQALGYDYHLINQYQEGGIIEWCEEITIIIKTGENLIKEVKNASHASLVTVLLEGEPGAGKTELAAYIAKSSNFSYIKVCDSENMGRLIQDNRRRAIKKVLCWNKEAAIPPRFTWCKRTNKKIY